MVRFCDELELLISTVVRSSYDHGDHLSGKHGNVREFDICQGSVRILLKIRELSGQKSCQGKVA